MNEKIKLSIICYEHFWSLIQQDISIKNYVALNVQIGEFFIHR